MERLEKQLALVIELDKLKSILRRTRVKSAEGRLENSGEHSWHVALMAILMEEHANAPVDICRVMKMLLIHDVVEIDAGDTFVYDTAASQEQVEKEIKKGVKGIIITHGTDTLAYTAAALSFMLQNPPLPILLVGSQRSSDRASSDAAINMICAAHFIAKTKVVLFWVLVLGFGFWVLGFDF